MRRIIKPEAAFHAEPALVGGAVFTLHKENTPSLLARSRLGTRRLVFHVIGQLAAHATIGANGIHRAVGRGGVSAALGIHQGGGHERARRAGLHAFAAGNAGAVAHGIIEIKYDLGSGTAMRQSDDIVALHFPTGSLAQAAGDAGVQIHVHGRMGGVVAACVWQRIGTGFNVVYRRLVPV